MYDDFRSRSLSLSALYLFVAIVIKHIRARIHFLDITAAYSSAQA